MANIFNKVAEYINKVSDVETRYNEKAEAKHEKLVEMELALQEKQKDYEAVHKMYLLDDVTEETYLTAKSEFEAEAQKVQQLKLDIGIIKKYELQDKEEIIAKVQEIEGEMNAEIGAITSKAQRKVLEAKEQYLKALAEAGTEYRKAKGYRVRVIELKNKVLGQSKNTYFGEAWETIGYIGFSDGGSFYTESAEVTRKEMAEAINDGKVYVRKKK